MIEGRLKLEYLDDSSMRVSHECLYQWVYDGHGEGWRRYLPKRTSLEHLPWADLDDTP